MYFCDRDYQNPLVRESQMWHTCAKLAYFQISGTFDGTFGICGTLFVQSESTYLCLHNLQRRPLFPTCSSEKTNLQKGPSANIRACMIWSCLMIHTGWCIFSRTTSVPHMVHLGNAPVYYLHVILLIWNISTRTIEVMCMNKPGKMYDVMWMASWIVKKQSFHLLSVSILWKIFVNVLKQSWKYPKLTCLIKNYKTAKKFYLLGNIQHLICGKKGYINWGGGETPPFPTKWSNVAPKKIFTVFSENTIF